MSNEQIIKYIKDNYRTQKQLYFWSTFILPDGEFIIPENEEYDGDLYEHANIIAGVAENCFDDNWMDAEEWLENNCVKCNATFPYVSFPSNPTNKQYWAAEEYIDYINKEGNSFEGIVDYAEAGTMQTPVQIIIPRDSRIYDLAVYSADDIINLVKRGRVGGMLGESKNMKNIVEAGGATKPISKWVNKRQNGIVHEFRGFNIFELPSGKFEIYDGKINEDNLVEDDLRSFEDATLYINLLSGMAHIKNRAILKNKDFIILSMSTGIDEKLRDLVELDLPIESATSKKAGHSYFIRIYGTMDELEALVNKLSLKSFIYLKSWDTKQKSSKVEMGSGAHQSDYSYKDLLKMGHASRRQDAINYYDNIVSEGLDEDMELNQVPDRKLDGQSIITFGDGNRERILAYLGLDSFSDLDELEGAIARAFEVEDEYLHQLKSGDFGYALTADFESIPHIIEDPADYKDLEEIESFGGITVYRKVKK